MTIGEILYTIIIKPLELIFELIFATSYDIHPNPAVNLIVMSLAINLLVLPLYRRADIIQAEAKAKENAIRPMVEHIKKSFKGDEKVMMLQTYYDQKHYHPLSSLKSIISLLLQIPFFIAAYQFLSHLTLLNGQSMGPIRDLSQPDGLITIGSITINLLPILMTVINIVSSEIYTKGQPFKDKIVLYLSAAVFLVLLYDSPSGLVFYWTFNNVFSLVKNIIARLMMKPHVSIDNHTFPPYDLKGIKSRLMFCVSSVYMAVLTGLLIPSSTIASSPDEFVFISSPQSPLHYVASSFCISGGLFVLWLGVFYCLLSNRWRAFLSHAMLFICVISSANYFFFSSPVGMVTTELVFDDSFYQDVGIVLSSTAVVVIIGVVIVLANRFAKMFARYIVVAGIVALLLMFLSNTIKINSTYSQTIERIGNSDTPSITLSRNGKNVVVIMLDWALSGMVPYIFQEDPTLVEKFDGFTYYPNTISFGAHTNFGAPALFGGYEYTPDLINQRSDEALVDKHNESLLVMPVLFDDNGFNTTVIDPPYVNYREIMDVSIFRPYPNIRACIAEGSLMSDQDSTVEQLESARSRNFFCYSLVRVAPAILQGYLYDGGRYNQISSDDNLPSSDSFHFPQFYNDLYSSTGMNQRFLDAYTVLESMPSFTDIIDDDTNCCLIMGNNSTHEPTLLKAPEYIPCEVVDNTEYEAQVSQRILQDGTVIHLDNELQMKHYHVNNASYRSLARWFDYLRDNGVWDNTRIILVSDHGRELGQFDNMLFEDIGLDVEGVNPILFVKDYDSHGFNISYDFMTNADVPTIATNGLIDDPVNPFTGNPINDLPKQDHVQYVTLPEKWKIQYNQGNTFSPGPWYSVHDNIFERSNWEYLGEY